MRKMSERNSELPSQVVVDPSWGIGRLPPVGHAKDLDPVGVSAPEMSERNSELPSRRRGHALAG